MYYYWYYRYWKLYSNKNGPLYEYLYKYKYVYLHWKRIVLFFSYYFCRRNSVRICTCTKYKFYNEKQLYIFFNCSAEAWAILEQNLNKKWMIGQNKKDGWKWFPAKITRMRCIWSYYVSSLYIKRNMRVVSRDVP